MSAKILRSRLEALRTSLATLGRTERILEALAFDQNPLLFPPLRGIWRQLQGHITFEILSHESEIQRILDALDQAAAPGKPVPAEILSDAWKAYLAVADKSRETFQQCLDTISGLVFREKKLGSDLCRLADELIWICGEYARVDLSMTVPASMPSIDSLAMTLGRILRHRYSEWNVWSLPLIAHEFGHVFQKGSNQDYLKADIEPINALKASPDDEDRASKELQEYIADSFATAVMGPAYACAAIHIRLNPAPAGSAELDAERRYDHERAEVILGILAKMNESTGPITQEYRGILDCLRADWDAMVNEADPARTRDPAAWGARTLVLKQVVNWLWNKYQTSRIMFVAIYQHNGPFEGWKFAKEWKEDLERPRLPKVTGASMLRDALNAGWSCRIEGKIGIRELEPEVVKLCTLVVDRRYGASMDRRAETSSSPSMKQ